MPSTSTSMLDGLSTSVAVKAPCKAVTTTSITLSGEQTIGGISCVTGDRVLVAIAGGSVNNGIWNVSTSAWTRAKDWDGTRDVVTGTLVLVKPGTTTSRWYKVMTSGAIIPGATTVAIEAESFGGSYSIDVETVELTAGSTVVTLTTMTYVPGVSSVAVFADGQFIDPADYTETNSTTITFDAAWASDVDVTVMAGSFLTAGIDAGQVSYTASGTGALARALDDELDDFVNVKNYGVVGDGTTNDRAAIQAVFNQFKRVYFPSGTYYMGQFSTSDAIVDLRGLGEGITIDTGTNVEFVCETTATATPYFFVLKVNSHFKCGPIRFRDTGAVVSGGTYRGAYGFLLLADTTSWGNLTFDSIYCNNMQGGIACQGNVAYRIRGIHVGQLFCDTVYYPFSAQNQGDGVEIDNLVAYNCIRPYFAYGVTAHKVNIYGRANQATSGAVNISRDPGGRDTSGIEVRYIGRDQVSVGMTHVLINHIDLLGGSIHDIKVHVDIEASAIYYPVRFVNYTGSGGSETAAASLNEVYDVEISGSCDVQASAISTVAAYTSRGRLKFNGGKNLALDSTTLDAFMPNNGTRAAVPTWTGSTTNPTLGNGTLTQASDLRDGLASVTTTLTIGSTTNAGSGEWQFSSPYEAAVDAIGSAYIFDAGTTYYIGACRINAGETGIAVFLNNVATAVGSANPITWATGDKLIFTVEYPIS